MVVKVLSTKVRVTGGSEQPESATTKVVHDDLRLATFLVKTVCDGRGRRLVDDAKDVKAGDSASVLGYLALCVLEV